MKLPTGMWSRRRRGDERMLVEMEVFIGMDRIPDKGRQHHAISGIFREMIISVTLYSLSFKSPEIRALHP